MVNPGLTLNTAYQNTIISSSFFGNIDNPFKVIVYPNLMILKIVTQCFKPCTQLLGKVINGCSLLEALAAKSLKTIYFDLEAGKFGFRNTGLRKFGCYFSISPDQPGCNIIGNSLFPFFWNNERNVVRGFVVGFNFHL